MSRRKKRSADRPGPPASAPAHDASAERVPPRADPPRPNKPLLLGAGILLLAWFVFLLAMAVAT